MRRILWSNNVSSLRLIYLYYYSMRHRDLYQCLKILSNQLSINPVRSCQTLYSVIKELST